MKVIENKNIIECTHCGERMKISRNATIMFKGFVISVIASIIIRFIAKKMVLLGSIMTAYTVTKFLFLAYICIGLFAIASVVMLFIGGGRGKCSKCTTKYKFNRYEYKNKQFNK